MSSGPSAVEFPSAAPLGAVDEDSVYAYELAIKLHEGRYRVIPRVVQVQTPAPGADWSVAVPPGVTWLPLSILALFTASAAVATRIPALLYGDGTTTFMRLAAGNSFAASAAARIGWIRGLGVNSGSTASGVLATPLPSFSLFGGTQISITTLGLDAADQWSQIAVYVIETTETTLTERAQMLRDLITGAHTDPYPELLKGL